MPEFQISDFKFQIKLEKTEDKISEYEASKKELEIALAQPDLYKNTALAAETKSKYDSVKIALSKEQDIWDALATEIETLEKNR